MIYHFKGILTQSLFWLTMALPTTEVIMQCKECLKRKPGTDFYGNDKMCKVCRIEKIRIYRAENIEAIREYDRQRANLPHRVEARIAYSKSSRGIARQKAANAKYIRSPHGSATSKVAKAKWIEANPLKRAAHTILGNAVRDGKLAKPGFCSQCNKPGRIHGHHEDYYKPLDVIWLCSSCHRAHHKAMDRGEAHEIVRTN